MNLDDNLYSLFRSRFPADPAAIFLAWDGGDLSYGAIEARSGRIAALLKRSGVEPGDRVVVQVEKSPDAVLLYLACLRVGAVFVPLNTGYTAAEIGYFLGDAAPKLFVTAPKNTPPDAPGVTVLTLGTDGSGSLLDRARDLAPDETVAPVSADDLAAILYTSGTTGRSKGAMLSHGNLAANARVLHEHWGWVPGDVLLHALPIYHVHGLFVALQCALLNGSTVLFHEKFDVRRIRRDLPKASVLMGVPTFYVRLLDDADFGPVDAETIRLFVAGSAPLLAETFAGFERRTGHRVLERYGMTETGMITSNPYRGERIAGSVGYALPGISVRIADAAGHEVPHGTIGVLEVKGPNVFKGYWRLPEKTREEFRPGGYFITGDLATMAEDGRVTIVGRAKDLVISGGFNVYPKEVEEAIDALPGVKESAVIGVPHPDLGEGVTAVVVTAPDAGLDEAAIATHLHDRLARFKQPKRIFFVADLPRNAMGKVQKNELRRQYAEIYAGLKA
jgi:malonyl-CoA/methylmalonyl-CoA synthetase